MTERHQSGAGMEIEHPDADQLTAFAEQALPGWERELVLGHLAGCAACREVVFLVQEGVPELAEAAAPRPRTWFDGWGLAWAGGVAALAAAMLLTVHVAGVARERHKPVTTAVVRQEVPAAPSMEAPVPPSVRGSMAALPKDAVAKKSAQAPAEGRARILAASPKLPDMPQGAMVKPVTSPVSSVHGAVPGLQLGMAASAGSASGAGTASAMRAVTPVHLGAGVPAPAPVVAAPRMVPLPQTMQNRAIAQGAAAPASADPQQVPQFQARNAQSYALQGGALQSAAVQGDLVQGQAGASGQAMGAQQNQAAGPPAPAQSQMANKTVEVTAAAASIMDEVAVSAENSVVEHVFTLPSHLPTVSAIENEKRVVAIDSKGGVFLSRDKGKSWAEVSAVWWGRPVQVGFASSDSGQVTTATPKLKRSAPVFELRTDTGLVWTSVDGLSWQRR